MSNHLPIFDQATAEGRDGLARCLERLRDTAVLAGDQAEATAGIVQDVAERGDAAVVEAMQRFTDRDFSVDRIRVTPAEIEAAAQSVQQERPDLLAALGRAIERIRAYQQHILPEAPEAMALGGATLGLRFRAVPSAGLCVPGGSAVLFSTLLMLAVPAQVAGVPTDSISVIHPPPTRDPNAPEADDAGGDISPIVLAACHMLGIRNVYRIGGAQGVAALAYGTATVSPVSLVAGPGNVFVQLAKAQVSGVVGTDNGFYGPSEIVSLVDDSADVERVAADLIAQAEHDPGKCFLVCWQKDVLEKVLAAVEAQLAKRTRKQAIVAALREASAAVLARHEDEAMQIVNQFAAEHVSLAVADPQAALAHLRHAGEVFLGDAAPVAAGDYYAGPSHCLPTGTTARFTSGVSVHTFLKRTGTVAYPDGMPQQAIDDIALLAEAEGLDAHAESVRQRRTPQHTPADQAP